jgi:hypothetical protein
MKKVMPDPRLQPDTNPMPFDGLRLIYGGFDVLVDAVTSAPAANCPPALARSISNRRNDSMTEISGE